MSDIKFFNPNEVNSKCAFTFTTADVDNAPFLYDNDLNIKLTSDGSIDGTLEKWTVEFESSKTVCHIAIFNHNIKTGNIKYLDSSLVEHDFSPAISFSGNTVQNNVFDVADVDIYGIVVNCTFSIDGLEKYAGELRALDEFGTLPRAKKIVPTQNIAQDLKTKIDGGKEKIINGIKFSASITFDDLDDTDLSTLFDLAERGRSFYIYLSPMSGDKAKRFFRVQDQYLVNMTNDLKPKLPDQLIDDVTWEAELKIEEV